jgi:hypothetical protein
MMLINGCLFANFISELEKISTANGALEEKTDELSGTEKVGKTETYPSTVKLKI